MTPSRSWNDLFADPRFHWTQPEPHVVALTSRWQAQGRRLIYDLGCGAGRHVAFLQTQGFEVIGTDIAPNGLAVCAASLRGAGQSARLVRADMTAAPFGDGSLDGGISTNVLNHGRRAALQQAVDEVHRVLKPGGEFFLTVLTTSDTRCGMGEEVEPGSFVLDRGSETGILHHFFTEDDVRAWLAGFTITRLERESAELTMSTRIEDMRIMRDAWLVWLRKR